MKAKTTTLLLSLSTACVLAQSGWVKITDPNNDISQYTTNAPYVGAAFIDINNDGFPDIYAAPKTLFLNNGNGTFALQTPLSFSTIEGTSGGSWADIDNDGDNDCVIAASPSRVFLNNGNGTFSNASSQVPGMNSYNSWACAIGDFNKDTLLDFIFAHAGGFHPGTPMPCKLFVQSGDAFSPQPVTGYPFTSAIAPYTNPFWSDYDLDGDMDLFIASGPVSMPGLDPCYKNMKVETGLDTLVKMTTELFATQTQDGQCYNFIDYDNDGDLDLCLTNYQSVTTRLYRNTGGVYSTVNTPFSNTTNNLASCWGDYDNDGDLDVVITNDIAPVKYYRNNGTSFTYVSSGFTTPSGTCGIANGDYDNDGDLDLFINGQGTSSNSASIGLYNNQSVPSGRNWVNIKLTGVVSNKSAIGALLQLKSTIDGNPVWQMREVNAQNSFQSQNDLRVHFGLKDAATIDSLVIRWPSGLVQYFAPLEVNQFYTLTEGEGAPTLATSTPRNAPTLLVYPNPATGGILHIHSSEKMLQMDIHDQSGKLVQHMDFGASGVEEAQIDAGKLGSAKGLLILDVKTKNGRSVQKVIQL